MCGVILVWTL